MKIGNRPIGPGSPAFVIAEIGHNHQGEIEICLKMIRAAALAGASAVKLQKRSNRDLYTPTAYNAAYVSENAYGKSYGEHREFLEFDREKYEQCIAEAERNGIIFFATAFDYKSVDFLMELNVPAFKIASGDLKSLPLIEYVSSFQKPMIISTGGGSLEDIDRAVVAIEKHETPYAILQCTAAYPPNYEELNLKVIETYKSRYKNAVIGYSGHDSGIAMSLVAYVLGAQIIEKHFTLNRVMKGTDHAFSLEPEGMRKLVRDLENARLSLGDGIKAVYESEKLPLRKMGKSLYASKALEKGHLISPGDIELRSPAEGLEPKELINLVGKKLNRSISQYDPFVEGDLN